MEVKPVVNEEVNNNDFVKFCLDSCLFIGVWLYSRHAAVTGSC